MCLIHYCCGNIQMPRPNTNKYHDLKNGMTQIITVKGDVYVIDTADRIIAKNYCWSRHTNNYARAVTRTKAGLKTLYLHRLLCQCSEDKPHVDHINGDVVDCRRANLRACDRHQNLQNQKRRITNTTGFKGVSFHALTGRFRARVGVRGHQVYVGLFDTPEAAAVAATSARLELHKEFARHA